MVFFQLDIVFVAANIFVSDNKYDISTFSDFISTFNNIVQSVALNITLTMGYILLSVLRDANRFTIVCSAH